MWHFIIRPFHIIHHHISDFFNPFKTDAIGNKSLITLSIAWKYFIVFYSFSTTCKNFTLLTLTEILRLRSLLTEIPTYFDENITFILIYLDWIMNLSIILLLKNYSGRNEYQIKRTWNCTLWSYEMMIEVVNVKMYLALTF